ncbi:MAG: peptidylprolyl isomerase [Gammaproteobacteria bacterium]|nr:peptidylprolyl isomerase [Gammaproteobacteria bacterium]
MMNKFYLAAILPMLAAGAGHAQESTEVDRVFAIVNEEVITRSEFERQLRDTVNEFRSRGAGLPEENVLRRRVLERMVDNRVQLQEAARLGFAVSEEDLAGALRGIAERNNLSVAQLRTEVEKQGMDYQLFRRGIRRQLLVEQLINRRIRSRVTVTDAEVDHHLAGSLREFFAGRELDVSHILLQSSAAADEIAQKRAAARKARAEIENGLDFAEAAVLYSEAGDALEGGRMGWVDSGRLPQLFLHALKKMQPGGVSEVLRSPNGFHIVRLNGIRGGQSQLKREVKLRHIMLKTDQVTDAAMATQRLNALRERIAGGEDFAAVAGEYSEDMASRGKGGDLGWFNLAELPRSQAAALSELDINEISRPVVMRGSVHLLQVLERRTGEAGGEILRNRARNQLLQRKTNDEYQRWLRELRGRAFIRYLDDFG